MIIASNGGVYGLDQTKGSTKITDKEVLHGRRSKDKRTGTDNQDTGGSRGDRASKEI